jgi:hypothetical protein
VRDPDVDAAVDHSRCCRTLRGVMSVQT